MSIRGTFSTMISQNNIIGPLGESIAAKFLSSKGFSVIQRNYRKKWGEIDIIAEKEHLIHFIEVKSVSRSLNSEPEMSLIDKFMPEENIHSRKIKRLLKTINSYLSELYPRDTETEWQLDALIVTIDQEKKKARVKMIENIAS